MFTYSDLRSIGQGGNKGTDRVTARLFPGQCGCPTPSGTNKRTFFSAVQAMYAEHATPASHTLVSGPSALGKGPSKTRQVSSGNIPTLTSFTSIHNSLRHNCHLSARRDGRNPVRVRVYVHRPYTAPGSIRLRLVRGPQRAQTSLRTDSPFLLHLSPSHLCPLPLSQRSLRDSSNAGPVSPPIWFVLEGPRRFKRFRLSVGGRGLSP